MSPSSPCFNFETSLTTSPLSTVELLHLGSSRVEDTTYLGRLFSLSAHSPLRDSHRVANHSSLRRPSSRASVPSASPSSTLAHASRSLSPIWPNQPPNLKPSSPVGSWTTPSSETFSLMTIFPMSVLLRLALSATTDADTATSESGRRPTAQFASRLVSPSRWKRDKEGEIGDQRVVTEPGQRRCLRRTRTPHLRWVTWWVTLAI